MRKTELIFRAYELKGNINSSWQDEIPISLKLIELNDGGYNYKKEFSSEEEAESYIFMASNIQSTSEFLILPSVKIRY